MRIIETRDAELMGRLGKVMQEKHIELYPTFLNLIIKKLLRTLL